jgi:hypothetical protein
MFIQFINNKGLYMFRALHFPKHFIQYFIQNFKYNKILLTNTLYFNRIYYALMTMYIGT